MTVPHAPSPPDLAAVVDCIADVLGVEPSYVDPDQLLTEAGLESFSAVRLRRRIRDDLGSELPLTAFLDKATARTLAADIAGAGTGSALADGWDVASTHPAADGASFPLTPIQTAYLVGRDASFPLGGVATFFYFEYDRRPDGDPEQDVQRLEAAWNRVVSRHPMLRTVVGEDVRQHTLAEVPPYRMLRVDLRGEGQPEVTLARLRAECSHQLRPVGRWPLFDLRATLLPDGRTRVHVGLDIIMLDLTSWMLLMREWGRYVADPGAELAGPARTFAEVLARREQDADELARRERDRKYWAGRLPTLPPGPALPWACSPAQLGVPRFVRHGADLPAEQWAALCRRAAARGVTSTAVLLAAFALVLNRWGATEPFCLNTTLFDRPETDRAGTDQVDTVVGDFTTTVLSEMPNPRMESGSAFGDYAAAVNRRFWTDLEHRSVSAVEVLRDRPGTDLSPAYPVVFTSGVGLAGSGEPPVAWLGEEVFGVSQTPQVFIDHIVWDEAGRLRVAWDVVDGCLPAGHAAGMRDAHLRLLRRLAEDEDAWADPTLGWDPSFLPDESVDGSPFAAAGPLLDDPLRRAAAIAPDRVALLGREQVGHAELADRADRTAAALAALGIGPGDLVAVCAPKGVAQIAATLGMVRAGAAYVPVEPGWPAARVASVCGQASIQHAVVAVDVDTSWPEGVQLHRLDGAGVLAGPDPSDTRPRRVRADDLAYTIFTSGSTGRPKGVAVEHRQARTTLDEMAARFPLIPDDRVLALSALSFDLSVYDVFGVLGTGAAMVLPEPDRQRDPGHWLEMAARHRVSVWNSAPALLEMLVEYAEIDPVAAAEALSALRLVLLSGDWIPVTLPDRLRALAPNAQVVSLGGATEGSIWSICHPIEAVDHTWASIPYGRALRGQSFHILDDGRPCPVGTAGELYIGGNGVARGYVGDPEQTAQRFTHHPLLRRRLYRTGDLGRWRYDGTIEFLGRVDRQVKIRGHRIELGEVESVLDRAPEVRQCVARSVSGPDGRPRLVAFVVPADADTPPAEDQLVARLRDHLPDYMVPSRFVFLPALPVTDNGKVDHAALPDPYRSSHRPPTPATGEDPSAGGPAGSPAWPLTPRADGETPELVGAEPATVTADGRTGVLGEQGAALAALLDDAVRSGLKVRVEVGAGELYPAAALAAAARLAQTATGATDLSYRVVARVGTGPSLLTLDLAAPQDGPPAPPSAPAGAPAAAVAAATAVVGPVDATTRAGTAVGVDLPDPAVEGAVAGVLSDLLGTPVDPDTPFFRLGATSLTLVQAHRRLATQIAADLAIVDLFAHPTVRALARRITAARTSVTSCGDVETGRAATIGDQPGTDQPTAISSPADPGRALAAGGPSNGTELAAPQGPRTARPVGRRQARALAAEAAR